MTYVLDTNCFIVTGHYYPDQFPSFWMKFNQAVDVNKIVSVREVFRELDNAATEPHLVNWIKTHKDIFPAPKSIETEFVQTIFSVKKHFQNLIKEKYGYQVVFVQIHLLLQWPNQLMVVW